MLILAVANQKGGVGKTTTAVTLAALLARHQRVLLVDLDQQASATIAAGVDPNPAWAETLRARTRSPRRAVALPTQPTAHGFDVLAGHMEFAPFEAFELTQPQRREHVLSDVLVTVADRYDTILIDCPPALGLLTVNALVAADLVVIPCSPAFLSVQGVARLFDSIADVQAGLNPRLQVAGIVPTLVRFVGHTMPRHMREQLAQLGAAGVTLLPLIPVAVAVDDAAGAGLPLPLYDATSPATRAYEAVATQLWPEVFTHA